MNGEATRTLDLGGLLRGEHGASLPWIRAEAPGAAAKALGIIALCGGGYGASIGAWRGAEQALFCAIKLPLLLVLTALVCAALNALWARRLGLDLSLAESVRAVLLEFAFAALLLAAVAPVLALFDVTLPGPSEPRAWASHDLLGFAHVVAIAVAGSFALARQRAWLRERCPHAPRARGLAVLWLAGHLVVCAQLSWSLRPWFGSPGLEVEFLRDRPLEGSFYESLIQMTLKRAH